MQFKQTTFYFRLTLTDWTLAAVRSLLKYHSDETDVAQAQTAVEESSYSVIKYVFSVAVMLLAFIRFDIKYFCVDFVCNTVKAYMRHLST